MSDKTDKKNIGQQKITSKRYFWIPIIFILILVFGSTTIIIIDISPSFCCSKICLDNFVDLFSIPLKLLALGLVILGAIFTYYRIDLSYYQNERQIYSSFRDEFLDILNTKPYEYKILDIPDIWLFNKLYPNAKDGDYQLLDEFEEYIKTDEPYYGFTGSMNELSKAIGSNDQYSAHSYNSIGLMFQWLRDVIPIDADLNVGFTSGDSFSGEYSKTIIALSKDIFFIVTSVNAFKGWCFFDNKTKRLWRKNIDRLDTVSREANQISEYFSDRNRGDWLNALLRNDLVAFNEINILEEMPENLRNNNNAKNYIFEAYTKRNKLITNDDHLDALKNALGLAN